MDSEGEPVLLSNEAEHANFELRLNGKPVGELSYKNGQWHFSYTPEFKSSGKKPVYGFPSLEREYTSEALWPFFAYRIPSLKQPSVQQIIKKEQLNSNDQSALLARFGRLTVTNPFELVPHKP